MVLGTCATRMPAARWCTRIELNAVSSPPIVISSVMPSCRSERTVRSSAAVSRVGFAREMPRVLPPRKWMRDTPSMVSGRTCVTSPCISHSKPSSIPTTSTLSRRARIVAAAMTLLIPGAGPPPTRMPRRCRSMRMPSPGPYDARTATPVWAWPFAMARLLRGIAYR